MNCKPGDVVMVVKPGFQPNAEFCDCFLGRVNRVTRGFMWGPGVGRVFEEPFSPCKHSMGNHIAFMADDLLKPLPPLTEEEYESVPVVQKEPT
jgi:hypothetical protein